MMDEFPARVPAVPFRRVVPPHDAQEAPVTRNSKQVLVMSLGAVIGAVLGLILGQFIFTPAILIPIGLVCGIAASLSVAHKQA